MSKLLFWYIKECHRACKTTCIKDGPDGCVDCNDGWQFNEGKCDGLLIINSLE